MSLLIDVDPKGCVILRPDVLKMCPEFSALDENEMLVIILVYDYCSIYRQHNERTRIGYAITRVYGDNNPKLLAALENKPPGHPITQAVNTYKALQYNRKVELIRKFEETIDEHQKHINPGLDIKTLKHHTESIEHLRKMIHGLEKEVVEEMIELGRIEGDQKLSFLELIQSNREAYKNMLKKK